MISTLVTAAATAREQRRQIAAAGADLQHGVVAIEVELLHDARLEFRRPHALTLPERNFEVRKGQRAICGWHEILAPHFEQKVQHTLVEHVPGPDLLLDHVEPRLLEIHPVFPRDEGHDRSHITRSASRRCALSHVNRPEQARLR